MKLKQLFFISLVLFFAASCGEKTEKKSYNKGIQIVPMPKEMVIQEGKFTLNKQTSFVVENKDAQTIVSYFKEKIAHSTGYQLDIKEKSDKNYIKLMIDTTLNIPDEGYNLEASLSGISITAATTQGAFYGMQTMMQLLPAEIESDVKVKNIAWEIPCIVIHDAPAFPYRGVMLDVCRHFHDVDFIKKQLDIMAMFKMNRFHWHLTDDHLWTIEIKKYPLLTQKGSIRHNADGSEHKGFYTQEQIKDIVAYAAERFITVIPEVELPGHALAALTAYPELSCTGGPFELRNKWGVEENVYCAGNEKTFEFLEDVINEVMPLFPGAYFHIGGDECPKVKWEACTKCKQRMQKEHLKNAHELQSYFIHRIEKTILAHNKRIVGWDEILEGGLAPSATVMSWRGEEGGITAAGLGHDVIMTPAEWLYIDFAQGAIEVEPIAINYPTLLSKTYNYNPLSDKIAPALQHHIIGAQCNMWTEYATTPDYTEYLMYPRVLAVAELNWTPIEKKNYDSFEQRLNNQLVRLDAHHINYHIPLPEGPMADVVAIIDRDSLCFTNSRNLPMIYTTDGSELTPKSTRYTTPIVVDKETNISIATLLPSNKISKTRNIKVIKEPLLPAYTGSTQSGMLREHAQGDFYHVIDTKDANWENLQIVNDFVLNPKLEDKGAFCYRGYFEVPADGVYYFSTEMDELQIDNKVVLSNDGQLIRHSKTRTSLALQKGNHSFRLLFINNNIGGYPRIWNNKGFIMATKGNTLQLPTKLSHQMNL